MAKTIKDLQESPDYVILNNPLASPKFIRLIGKGNEITVSDTYTPKIFYEIASRLTPEHLVDVQRDQSIMMEINIKEFLVSIGGNPNNFKHFIDSVQIMQSNLLRWKEGDDYITTAIVTKTVHTPKTGKVVLYVDSDIAKRILEVKANGNFSFLKSNVFRLQNAQAIKLYPFFKSWVNNGYYQTDLERFKKQFDYDTPGYKFWNNFREKVIEQALGEINEKTDLLITYTPTGTNLDGKRPRITGINFSIKKKKILPIAEDIVEQVVSKVDVSELIKLFKDIPLETESTEQAIQNVLEKLVGEIGYQAVKDGLLGMAYTKAKPKSISFFTAKNLLKYPNFEAEFSVKKENEKALRAAKKKAEQDAKLITEIKRKYEKAKDAYYKKTYEELSDEERERRINDLYDSSTFKGICFKEDSKEPTLIGITLITDAILQERGYNAKQHLLNYAKQVFNVNLDYNEEGSLIVVE